MDEITVDDSQEGTLLCAVKPNGENMTLFSYIEGHTVTVYLPHVGLAHPFWLADFILFFHDTFPAFGHIHSNLIIRSKPPRF